MRVTQSCISFSSSASFFFYSYLYHQDLHSFPTRRSSDLHAPPSPQGRRATAWAPVRAGIRGAGAGRSEEHTSELQSLRHIVCRLLLEKKKKIYFHKQYKLNQHR